jgi:hypothetical protein
VRTVYTIVGDLFAEICFVLTAIGLVIAWRWPHTAEAAEVPEPKRRKLATNGRSGAV